MRTLITLSLICLATAAFAGNHPSVQATNKLDTTNIRLVETGKSVDAEMVLGNLNEPVNEIADWAYGNEAYTYLIVPEQVASCSGGFAPLSVTFYMNFGPEDVPATFAIQGALRDATDDGTGNKIPGERLQETPVYEVTLEEEGSYELIVPFDEIQIAYVLDEGPFFAELYLPYSFPDGQFPGILADENPLPTFSFYNFFLLGWEDLVADYSWTGCPVVRINADCGDGSVATEIQTFDGVKSMFR